MLLYHKPKIKFKYTWVTLNEINGCFLIPNFLQSLYILLPTAVHILPTSFQGSDVSNDSAINWYLNPKSLKYPIINVRK